MPEIKADNKKIAKNTLFLYGRMFFSLILSLYTSRVILSNLGVEDFGIYNVVGGFVSMFAFINSALVGATQRFYNVENSQKGDEGVKKVFNVSIVVQGVLAVLLFVLLESIGIWYVNNVMVLPEERLLAANVVFQVSAVSLLLLVFQIPFSAAIVSFERLDFYAFLGIIDVVLKFVLVLILPFIPYDSLIVYAFLMLSINILNFCLNFFYARKNFKMLRYERKFDKGLFKSMMSFSGWNFFDTFSTVLYSQGLNMILNLFFGPVVNAARGVANQVYGAIKGFSQNIVISFRPQLVDSYAKGDYDRTRMIMFNESKICFFMLFLLSMPVMVQIDFILKIWLGDNVPHYTNIFVQLILLKMIISTFNVPFTQVVHATGNIRTFHLITSGLTILIAPISYVFLKLGYDATVVFVISIIISIMTQIACVFILKGLFEYSITQYIKSVIIPCLLVAVISTALPVFLKTLVEDSFFSFIYITLLCVVITVVVSLFLLMNASQRKQLFVFIKKKISKEQ